MKTEAEIIAHLARSVEECTFGRVQAAAVRPTDRIIADLGLDSLDYATIMLAGEQWAGMKIDEDRVRWGEIDTIQKLAALFVAHSNQ